MRTALSLRISQISWPSDAVGMRKRLYPRSFSPSGQSAKTILNFVFKFDRPFTPFQRSSDRTLECCLMAGVSQVLGMPELTGEEDEDDLVRVTFALCSVKDKQCYFALD